EYGATCAIFPVDAETLRYLEFSGRPAGRIALVEAYTKEQGLFHDETSQDATYSETLELDLSIVEPSLAGPKRPQDRVALSSAASDFLGEMRDQADGKTTDHGGNGARQTFPASDAPSSMTGQAPEDDDEPAHRHSGGAATRELERASVHVSLDGREFDLEDGAVVIAAITSCTNTSNPSVMLGAGLLAKKARERGLERKPWVKTSLAPGSKVVTDYLDRAELTQPLAELGFSLVGYGCTTCIGNSGPLPEAVSAGIEEADLTVCSVLSGNRNFEGRIHPEVKMNYLASPPLCVAYALAGRMDFDMLEDPLGEDRDGEPVYLRDLWPSQEEVNAAVEYAVQTDMFRKSYGEVFEGDENWSSLKVPEGDRYAWDDASTYVKRAPYFEGMEPAAPEGFERIAGARAIALLGDSVTTDHISPAGAIKKDTPGGSYLVESGVEQREFNSYGSRRGNHEVMVRGTFANVRLRNQLAPGTEGGYTKKDGSEAFIFDAAMEYADEGTPLCVLAGKQYGSGSSRDWAAKGPRLLGIRFVVAESYERIHRSNLVGMGVLPLQFADGESVSSLGLTGFEIFTLEQLEDGARTLGVTAEPDDGGGQIEFEARVRIDTPNEWLYYRHGGILHFVLRQLRDRG
ncbi:MAG: aconitate hydratase, partial [Thermoleophilaceae bacterium]